MNKKNSGYDALVKANIHMAQKLVDSWNRTFKIGQQVKVMLDSGREMNAYTRSEAWLCGGHSAVIMVSGIVGAYSLERVLPA